VGQSTSIVSRSWPLTIRSSPNESGSGVRVCSDSDSVHTRTLLRLLARPRHQGARIASACARACPVRTGMRSSGQDTRVEAMATPDGTGVRLPPPPPPPSQQTFHRRLAARAAAYAVGGRKPASGAVSRGLRLWETPDSPGRGNTRICPKTASQSALMLCFLSRPGLLPIRPVCGRCCATTACERASLVSKNGRLV
jgi:hypothetical protein